jgi:hypothetical protein
MGMRTRTFNSGANALMPSVAGDRVDAVLGSELTWYEAFQGVAYPPPHFMLIFVGDSEEEEHQAASKAATRVSELVCTQHAHGRDPNLEGKRLGRKRGPAEPWPHPFLSSESVRPCLAASAI